jgi:hypothetical protein
MGRYERLVLQRGAQGDASKHEGRLALLSMGRKAPWAGRWRPPGRSMCRRGRRSRHESLDDGATRPQLAKRPPNCSGDSGGCWQMLPEKPLRLAPRRGSRHRPCSGSCERSRPLRTKVRQDPVDADAGASDVGQVRVEQGLVTRKLWRLCPSPPILLRQGVGQKAYPAPFGGDRRLARRSSNGLGPEVRAAVSEEGGRA